MNQIDVAQYIDHTLLKPEADREMIRKLCKEAKEYHFLSVCVNPMWVPFCTRELEETDVKVCTVVGFPLGATSTEAKVCETLRAVQDGAEEIDMVMKIGAMKTGDIKAVEEDIRAIVQVAKPSAIVKVIIETGLLSQEEKIFACKAAQKAGADFVKTSTGFGGGGATIEDIRLMRDVVGNRMGVKASGGVKDYETAMRMIDAGATRIGTSSGVQIVSGMKKAENAAEY